MLLSRQMIPPRYSLNGMPPNSVHASLVADLSLDSFTAANIMNTRSNPNSIIALIMNVLSALSIVVIL